MNVYYQIFIKSSLNIKTFAEDLRKILNCNSANQSKWQVDQERDGINHGGLYFLFELIGIEIKLLKNEGEVFEGNFKEYGYYLICSELEPINPNAFKNIIIYLSLFLQTKGIENYLLER